MSLQRIKALVPPPARPSEVGSLVQWREVEQQLGIRLPRDYRDFIYTYGSGMFAKFYLVYNPFASSKFISLVPSVERACNALRECKRAWPDHVPYQIYPEQPGLLPWGCDENGNDYYWLTTGSPESWHVVSDEIRGEGLRKHNRNMTDFLADVLLGKVKALASNYPKDEHRTFEAWRG